MLFKLAFQIRPYKKTYGLIFLQNSSTSSYGITNYLVFTEAWPDFREVLEVREEPSVPSVHHVHRPGGTLVEFLKFIDKVVQILITGHLILTKLPTANDFVR